MNKVLLSIMASICLSSAIYAQGTPSQSVGKTATPATAVSIPAVNTDLASSTASSVTDVNYVIGPEDVLSVFVWKEPELSQTMSVRPDGKISLPLLNDLQASGLTAIQLKELIVSGLNKYISAPTVTVIVQTPRSQKASIIGEVTHPGTYLLNGPTSVVQLVSLAGGFRDFAGSDKVNIIRQQDGQTVKYKFNYKDFSKGKNLDQNIQLKPGDIIVVP